MIPGASSGAGGVSGVGARGPVAVGGMFGTAGTAPSSFGGTGLAGTGFGGFVGSFGGSVMGGQPNQAGQGGQVDPGACSSGFFSGALGCLPWTTCYPGQYVKQSGSAKSDRICAPCPEDETTSTENASACAPYRVAQISVNTYHACAVWQAGHVKCWGLGAYGALGYGSFVSIGDDELPSSVGQVSIANESGTYVTQVAAGQYHSCARISDGVIKCWGYNESGELGYGSIEGDIGGVDLPVTADAIPVTDQGNLGTNQIVTGRAHSCALLADGSVTCWGDAASGQLGYGNVKDIGDDEAPLAAGEVHITSESNITTKALAAGEDHTCALLSDGTVHCWGANSAGQLGLGHTDKVGDDELPSSQPAISLSDDPDVTAVQITAGFSHTCALLSDDSVRCWGNQLTTGLGTGEAIGDDDSPADYDTIDFGMPDGVTPTQLSAGLWHTCARFSDGTLKCWGTNISGQLGYGSTMSVLMPGAVDTVSVSNEDARVDFVAAGGFTTCVLLSTGGVKCWGWNDDGQLGLGHTSTMGDDEVPADVEEVGLD